MCRNPRYIINKYTDQKVLVPCGKCDVCQETKSSARAFRIKRSIGSSEIALFVTLTYSNEYLPVVKRDDIYPFNVVNVYRRNHGCWNVVDTIQLDSLGEFSYRDLCQVPSPTGYGSDDYISVALYSDIQKFLKRLRVNLVRKFNYHGSFKYYATTEYGETCYRSHSHLLLIIPREFEETFRLAVAASWSYHDTYRLPRWIEVAYDAAKYVSSYVNVDSDFPKILLSRSLRAKHAYSKFFGLSSSEFTFASLLSKVQRGSLRYMSFAHAGKSRSVDFLFPKYVINRYFPLFKGFTRLAPDSARIVLACPARLTDFSESYTLDDVYKISISLFNHYEKVRLLHSSSSTYTYSDYCIDYMRVWTCYASSCLRDWYQSQENSLLCGSYRLEDWYDNLFEVGRSELPTIYGSSDSLCLLPRPWCSRLYLANNVQRAAKFARSRKVRKDNYLIYKNLKYLR